MYALGLLLICCSPIPAQDTDGPKQASRPELPGAGVSDNGRDANASTDSETAKDMEKRFGTESVHVPGGPMKVIFIEGRYIDAPYHLMRRGLAVYVNGIEVKRVEWLNKYHVAEDPPLPEGLNADSRLAEIKPWMCKKAGYCYSHFPPEEAVQKAIEAFRALPCVKQVALQLPDGDTRFVTIMHVELQSGEVRDCAEEYIDLRPRRKETVRLELADSMEYWERLLRGGRSVLYHARWRRAITDKGQVSAGLPEIVAILKTEWPVEKKAAALQPFFSDRFSDAEQLQLFLKPLLTDFQGSPQLDARIEMIRKEREDTYRQY